MPNIFFLALSTSLSLSLSLWLCLSQSLTFFSVSVPLSLFSCLSFFPVCLPPPPPPPPSFCLIHSFCLSVCLSFSLSLSLSFFLFLSLTFSLSLSPLSPLSLTLSNARTHARTHTHTRKWKKRRCNACTICHYLVSDKPCRHRCTFCHLSDKTCRSDKTCCNNVPRKPCRSRRGGKNERRKNKVIVGFRDRLPSDSSSSPTPCRQPAELDFYPFSSALLPHSEECQHTPSSPSSDRDDLSASSLSAPLRPPHRQLLHIPLSSSSAENTLLVCLFNARSVDSSRRRSDISTFIQDSNINIMLLTETWLRPAGDEAKIADLAPPGYSVLSFPRSAGGSGAKGGGIAFVIRDSLKPHVATTSSFPVQYPCFGTTLLTLTYNKQLTNLFCICHPKRTNSPTPCFSINFPTSFNTLTVCLAKHSL